MKSRRQQNTIIMSFIFYIFLILILLISIFSYFIPQINEIKILKENNNTLSSDYNRINISGQSFSEFRSTFSSKSTSNSNSSDEEKKNLEYINSIILEIDKDFYDEVFINTWSGNYDSFLKDLKLFYSSNDDNSKIDLIQNILPVYSEIIKDVDGVLLSDFMFINYLESIIETFNLSYSNQLWISWLSIVEDFKTSSENSLDTNLYYIPISLNVDWTKANLLDFLYYSYHVWAIELKDDNIFIWYNIDEWFENFKELSLKWQVKTGSYNIFDNHIYDIESISLKNSIDGDLRNFNWEDFFTTLKKTQWNDELNLALNLRFYVKSVPNYKLEEYIKWFLLEFSQFKSDVLKKIKSKEVEWYKLQNLKSINEALLQLEKTNIKDLKSTKWKELEDLYKKAYQYKKVIDWYKNDYNELIK